MADSAAQPIIDLANSWMNKAKNIEDKIVGTPGRIKTSTSPKPPATTWHDDRYKTTDQKAAPRKAAPRKRTSSK
jgi:hypothetical protein